MSFKNNINHSVVRWPYSRIPMEDFLKSLSEAGVNAIELVDPKDYPLLKKYNIHCSMCHGAEISFTQGWNDMANHETLIDSYSKMIPIVADAGYKNLICFSGSRNGIDDDLGLKNCVEGLRKIISLAEEYDVILQMELLNSLTAPHEDYMCDHSEWGVELCKRIDSDNFKLLYDIYHMQTMEGNLIRTIRTHHKYFGHYHTGGVPGRQVMDENQELNYPAIMKAILKTGFEGYVAQEFIPTGKDKVASLLKGIGICDV